MDHVEAQILDRVAKLYPETYQAWTTSAARFRHTSTPRSRRSTGRCSSTSPTLSSSRRSGAPASAFCYPQVSDASKEIRRQESFDLALAGKLVPKAGPWCATTSSWPGPSGLRCPARTRAARPRSPGPSVSCTTWPASATRYRAPRPGCSCPTRCSPTSSAGRTSQDLRGKLEDDLTSDPPDPGQATATAS